MHCKIEQNQQPSAIKDTVLAVVLLFKKRFRVAVVRLPWPMAKGSTNGRKSIHQFSLSLGHSVSARECRNRVIVIYIYSVHRWSAIAWLKLCRILIKFVFYKYTDVVKRFCVPFVAVIYSVHDVIYCPKHRWNENI